MIENHKAIEEKMAQLLLNEAQTRAYELSACAAALFVQSLHRARRDRLHLQDKHVFLHHIRCAFIRYINREAQQLKQPRPPYEALLTGWLCENRYLRPVATLFST